MRVDSKELNARLAAISPEILQELNRIGKLHQV